ncbi:MAG: DEAD/DEAH box helicase, partial [Alphaproteobacteria bacterium]
MSSIFESEIEEFVIELLQGQEFEYLSPEHQEKERKDLGEVVLLSRLRDSIERLNPALGADVKQQALKQILNLPTQSVIANNEAFHRMLSEGIEVEFMVDGNIRGDKVRLIDFDEVRNN